MHMSPHHPFCPRTLEYFDNFIQQYIYRQPLRYLEKQEFKINLGGQHVIGPTSPVPTSHTADT
jgi:hypothetical protein